MRGNPNAIAVRRWGAKASLLFIATFVLAAFVACSGSSDESLDPTPTVFVTPAGPPTLTPTSVPSPSIATPTSVPSPTIVPPTPAPVATNTPSPAPTVGSDPSPTSAPAPTATPAPPTATPFPLGGEFFLNLIEPADLDVFATSSFFEITGQTRIDAVVTVNDDIVTPNADGLFAHTVNLDEGINIIEVVGSVSADEQKSYVITVVYLP